MSRWKHGDLVTIGIVGGVGSGKSTVARMFADLGCVVVDSDVEARRVLQQPDVVDTLRTWWTEAIMAPDGSVDRKAVAAIVFADRAQRSRLEALVHPRISAQRAEVIQQASREGRPGVVIDAPLLYEAGVDRECDVVVFVDCPLEVRIERVGQSRGWTRADLESRENAQWPLDVKRERADYHVVNSGDPAELRGQVFRVFSEITSDQRKQ
jgi:dephospho-CoA kinase